MKKIGRTLKRRRHEPKTDYGARLNLLKQRKMRVVVRRTNRYIIAQLVESEIAQDKVLKSVTSKDLLEHGWPKEMEGSLKSIQAAYLTGYLLGKTSKAKHAILDMGMQRTMPRGRIYAVVKGLIAAGVAVPHSAEALPTEEQMKHNAKLKGIIEKVTGGIK